jgi:dUTPase
MSPDSLAATGARWTIETMSRVTVRVRSGVAVAESMAMSINSNGTVDRDSWPRTATAYPRRVVTISTR